MLNISRPHCGELRSEEEFHVRGQAHILRPPDPNACNDGEWDDYMFFRDSPCSLYHELRVYVAGCRKYFNVIRHTVIYEILETYLIGEQPSVVADGEKEPIV